MTPSLYPEVAAIIQKIDLASISKKRRADLQDLIDFIEDKIEKGKGVHLNFICTHNSRRSHLAQIWAQVMASYFSFPNVFAYSGGTEATAMFPVIGKTLSSQGLEIITLSQGQNPVYAIKYAENAHPVIAFSKKYDHPLNPTSNFAAIMTCSEADDNCPFILGTEKRIPITYEDPKVYDNTPSQSEKYMERSIQIASEMFFVFSQIGTK